MTSRKHFAFLAFVSLCLVFDTSTVQAARAIPRPVLRARRSITSPLPSIKYVVMLDAGSSGTRVHVYRYVQTGDEPVSWRDVSQILVQGEDKVKPGISSYHEKPEDAASSLKPLIKAAKSTVPKAFHSQTNIFLFATAGIRSLLLDHKTKKAADRIIEEIRKFLSDKSSSPFNFQIDFARVITGQEESVFSWITVNWLQEVLNTDRNTYGTLDLGGSSVEVGYEFESNDQHVFELKMKRLKKLVYAVAHEHFGANEARKLHLIKVVESIENGGKKGKTPCFNRGHSESFPYNGRIFKISGTGNGKKCLQYCKRLFTEKNSCPVEPCSMDTTGQPPIKGRLYLFSAFYFSMKTIGALTVDCGQTLTYNEIEPKIDDFCDMGTKELSKLSNPYAHITCHQASHALAVLKYGFKIEPGDTELIFVGEMKGFQVGWSLGAMLYNMNIL